MVSGYHLTARVYFGALLKRHGFQEALVTVQATQGLRETAREGSEGQRGLVMASLGGSQDNGGHGRQEDA